MNFVFNDLGHQSKGTRVKFTLSGNSANVRLLDSSNFAAYKAGRDYEHFSVHALKSPVVLAIPSSGRWYGVVDFGGYKGSGQVSIEVLPVAA